METIYTSYATNYVIAKVENGNYVAYHINEPQVHYVINKSNHWRYLGEGKKYMNNNTKLRILRGMATSTQEEVEEFLEFYEKHRIMPTTQETPRPENNTENGEDNMSDATAKAILNKLEEMSKPTQLETQMIEAIISKGKDIATETLERDLISKLDKHILDQYGKLPTVMEIANKPELKPITGIFHNRYENLVKMVYGNIPTMLVGPAGSGKNHTLEQIAESLSLDFYFTNAITQEHKLTGFIDAHGNYHETEFYKAFKNGGMFFFDEIDASVPDALIIVNAAIANGYFDFPHERITAHENFRIVAAANTFGHGADMVYVGRSQLDGATLDRFAVVEFDYDKDVEQTLAQDEGLYNLVLSLRNTINKLNLRYTMSTRAIINARKMVTNGLSHTDAIQFGIIKSIATDDLRMIEREIKVDVQSEWSREFFKLIKR